MTDKELVRRSSRAAGYVASDDLAWPQFLNVYDATGEHDIWNPLTDDRDMIQLVIALREKHHIIVQITLDQHGVTVTGWLDNLSGNSSFVPVMTFSVLEPYGDNENDMRIAIRRAVVRAADKQLTFEGERNA